MKDINDFKLVPYAAQRHYPEFDAEDPMTPFVEAVDLDNTEDKETDITEVKSYDGGRVKFIKIKGTFADAIKAGVLSAQKPGAEIE